MNERTYHAFQRKGPRGNENPDANWEVHDAYPNVDRITSRVQSCDSNTVLARDMAGSKKRKDRSQCPSPEEAEVITHGESTVKLEPDPKSHSPVTAFLPYQPAFASGLVSKKLKTENFPDLSRDPRRRFEFVAPVERLKPSNTQQKMTSPLIAASAERFELYGIQQEVTPKTTKNMETGLLLTPATITQLLAIDTSFIKLPNYDAIAKRKALQYLNGIQNYAGFCSQMDEVNMQAGIVLGRALMDGAWCKVIISALKHQDIQKMERSGRKFLATLRCVNDCLSSQRLGKRAKSYWAAKSTKYPGLDVVLDRETDTAPDHSDELAAWVLEMLRDHSRYVQEASLKSKESRSHSKPVGLYGGEDMMDTEGRDNEFTAAERLKEAKSKGWIPLVERRHGYR